MKLFLASAKYVSYMIFLIFVSSFLFFSVIEVAPTLLGKLNLDKIRYYAHKKRHEPDDRLAFRPKNISGYSKFETILNGDLYAIDPKLADFVEPMALKYSATYTNGFRTNSGKAPYNMLVLGDSFIDIGESDRVTFSELLGAATNLSTFNLGRPGYGPYQYKFLLDDHLTLHPRYALFCFFAGNDILDIERYETFLAGGTYNSHLRSWNFFERYGVALADTFEALKPLYRRTNARLRRLVSTSLSRSEGKHNSNAPPKVRDYIGAIALNGEVVPMRFSYWNQKHTSEELVKQKEWQSLKKILENIQRVARENDVEPIALYIPSKIQVYGDLFESDKSGSGFLKRIQEQIEFERNSVEAFESITRELNFRSVDLYRPFKESASQGGLLFYPFDTHWSADGRALAAETVAPALGLSSLSKEP